MKKIISLILLATLFVACGDDDEDPNNGGKEPEIEYLDPALIEGTWIHKEAGTRDDYIIFRSDRTYTNFVKDRYTGYISSQWEYNDYKISADRIYYKRDADNKQLSIEYILEGDSILKMKINSSYRAYKKNNTAN